jgi:hypothetical protein
MPEPSGIQPGRSEEVRRSGASLTDSLRGNAQAGAEQARSSAQASPPRRRTRREILPGLWTADQGGGMGIQTGSRDGSKSINCPRVLESHLSHNSCEFHQLCESIDSSWRLGVVSWNLSSPAGDSSCETNRLRYIQVPPTTVEIQSVRSIIALVPFEPVWH